MHLYNKITMIGLGMNYTIIIIKKESAVQGRERVRTPYQSEDPNPTQPTRERKKQRIKKLETKKEQIRPTSRNWLYSYNPPVPHHQTRGH